MPLSIKPLMKHPHNLRLIAYGSKVRQFVQADSVEELRAFFERWKGVVVPVGKNPGAYHETWCVAEYVRNPVCGGVL